jgi:hypothetical protein
MRETGVFPLSRFPLFREWDVSGDVMVAVGEFVQSRNRAIVQLSMVLRDCTNVAGVAMVSTYPSTSKSCRLLLRSA